MGIILRLLRWGVRIAFYFICGSMIMYFVEYGGSQVFVMCNAEYFAQEDISELVPVTSIIVWTLLIAELFFATISFTRFASDSIISVVTGWNAFGDVGTYEYSDNSKLRISGWLAYVIALALRILMIALIYVALCEDLPFAFEMVSLS